MNGIEELATATTTAVTCTLMDANNILWLRAKAVITFVAAPNTAEPYLWNGSTFQMHYYMENIGPSGQINVDLPSNLDITPDGFNSRWRFDIAPNWDDSRSVTFTLMVSGTSMDLSSAFQYASQFVLTDLVPSLPIPRASGDTYVETVPNEGQIYFDTANQVIKFWSNNQWLALSTAVAAGGMVYPPTGIAVSTGNGWDTSIAPATLTPYPPVGIGVSTGTSWGASIDPATLVLTNVANTFTADQTISTYLSVGNALSVPNVITYSINAQSTGLTLNPGAGYNVTLNWSSNGHGVVFGSGQASVVGSMDNAGNFSCNGLVTSAGLDATSHKIVNVANGVNPTDAINLSQLTSGAGTVYPPAGIGVSTGSAWGTSIDPATVPRLNVANTFTLANTFNNNIGVQGDEYVAGMSHLANGWLRLGVHPIATGTPSISSDGTQLFIENTSSTTTTGAIQTLGPAGSYINLHIVSGTPLIDYWNAGAGTDLKAWEVGASSTGTLHFTMLNDAGTQANDWMAVTRSGFVPTLITMGSAIQVNGSITVAANSSTHFPSGEPATANGSGGKITWNISGSGEVDSICYRGGGSGGYNWYNVPGNYTVTSATVPSMQIDSNDDLWVKSNITAGGNITSGSASHVNFPTTIAPSQGLAIGWNAGAGSKGETDFINAYGGGVGGFNWYNVANNVTVTTSTPYLMNLDSGGNVSFGGTFLNMGTNSTTLKFGICAYDSPWNPGFPYIRADASGNLVFNAYAGGAVFFNHDAGVGGAFFRNGSGGDIIAITTRTALASAAPASISADTSNCVFNAPGSGTLYFNWDHGYGVIFGNGAGTQVAKVDQVGNFTCNGNITPSGSVIANSGIAAHGPGPNLVGAASGVYLLSNTSQPQIVMMAATAPVDSKYSDCYADTVSGALHYRFATDALTGVNEWMTVGRSGLTMNGMTINGDLHVNGNLSAGGAKPFIITHPLDPTKNLTHACIEGPEAAVYYRGEGMTIKGFSDIILPDYFEALTRLEGRTVILTQLAPEEPPAFVQLATSAISYGRFKVFSSAPSARFYWEVKAIRKDIPELEVETNKPEDSKDEPEPRSK